MDKHTWKATCPPPRPSDSEADKGAFPALAGYISPARLAERPDGVTGPVLVALSGGADSRVLFDQIAHECERNHTYFYACHVQHGIRGEESLRDRDFCLSLAKSCPSCRDIFLCETDVPALAARSGQSLETEARRVRYAFFEKPMRQHHIPILCTAHNADDNLETLLFHLVRGCGVGGMCGIPPVRDFAGGRLVRPLLGVSKADILAYCQTHSLAFVSDSTNSDTAYTRNKIRLEVIPLLETINPSLRRAALRLSDAMRQLCAPLRTEALSLFEGNQIPAARLREPALSAAAFPFVLTELMRRGGFDTMPEQCHIDAFARMSRQSKDGACLSLPGKAKAVLQSGYWRVVPDSRQKSGAPAEEDYAFPAVIGPNALPTGGCLMLAPDAMDETSLPADLGRTDDNGGKRSPAFSDGEASKNPASTNIYKFATKGCMKFDTINKSLLLRCRKPGDVILCGGMHKSVRKLMNEKKLPPPLRSRFPLICDAENGEILCLPGLATADGARRGIHAIHYALFL